MNGKPSSETEHPKNAIRRPENERKVWAESYPGGDLQIEVGHIDNSEELYLMSGEAEALREILNELSPDDGSGKDDVEGIACVLCDEVSETPEDHEQHMEEIHDC